MRALGIDPGSKRIGLAICDDDGLVAVALDTIEGVRKLSDRVRRIARLAEREGVGAFVVGLPLHMDGTQGASARAARALGDRLAARTGLPVHYEDERLTSVEARAAMSDAGASTARQDEVVDRVAATIILQAWLDRRARGG